MKALVAEFIGTFALIFIGAGAGVVSGTEAGGGLVAVALAHGLVIVLMAVAFGHLSGTHINPAVTLGLAGVGKFEWSKVPGYLVAQLLGGLVGGYLLFAIFGGGQSGLGTPAVGEGYTLWGALALEFIGTFLLVTVVFTAGISGRGGALTPYAIGMTVGAFILFAGPISGSSLNPARTLGPAIPAGIFGTYIWLAIVAEILGGLAAGLLYKGVFEVPGEAPTPPAPAKSRPARR